MKTIHQLFLMLLFITSGGFLYGQTPQWTIFEGRNVIYPQQKYYVGFAERRLAKNERVDEVTAALKNDALTLLTESIEVTIQSETAHHSLESGNTFEESFKVSSTTSSNLTLSGIKYETFHDRKTDKAFALAFVNKDDLKSYYTVLLNMELDKLEGLVNKATKSQSDGRREEALMGWYSCMPVLASAEETFALITLLKANSEMDNRLNNFREAINSGFSNLKHATDLDMAEAAAFIADGIKQQIHGQDIPVILSNFTYHDTRMASPFSRQLNTLLEEKLTTRHFRVFVDGSQPESARGLLVLKGSYWDEAEKLKLIAIVKDSKTSETLAGIDVYTDKKQLESQNIDFLPQNFQQAMADQKAFRQDEVVGGGLLLECWTNKGNDSPIFVSGETMKLFFRVNQPTWVRLIYYLADGSKTLLYNKYYIDESKVNQAVEIPGEFVCAPPFGAETLQVLAQTEAFGDLTTQNTDGYEYITDDTKTIITKTRGMMRKSVTDLKAEKRIVITTMKE